MDPLFPYYVCFCRRRTEIGTVNSASKAIVKEEKRRKTQTTEKRECTGDQTRSRGDALWMPMANLFLGNVAERKGNNSNNDNNNSSSKHQATLPTTTTTATTKCPRFKGVAKTTTRQRLQTIIARIEPKGKRVACNSLHFQLFGCKTMEQHLQERTERQHIDLGGKRPLCVDS